MQVGVVQPLGSTKSSVIKELFVPYMSNVGSIFSLLTMSVCGLGVRRTVLAVCLCC